MEMDMDLKGMNYCPESRFQTGQVHEGICLKNGHECTD